MQSIKFSWNKLVFELERHFFSVGIKSIMPAKIIAVKSLEMVKVKKKGLLNIRFQKFLHFKIVMI